MKEKNHKRITLNNAGCFFSKILLICNLVVLNACYEDQEGCLDINATNFDVEADINCPDCCTFPMLQLDYQHKAETADTTINFSYESITYQDGAGNPFRVRSVQYYLSDFHLIIPGGDTVQVADTIQINSFTGASITPER